MQTQLSKEDVLSYILNFPKKLHSDAMELVESS